MYKRIGKDNSLLTIKKSSLIDPIPFGYVPDFLLQAFLHPGLTDGSPAASAIDHAVPLTAYSHHRYRKQQPIQENPDAICTYHRRGGSDLRTVPTPAFLYGQCGCPHPLPDERQDQTGE